MDKISRRAALSLAAAAAAGSTLRIEPSFAAAPFAGAQASGVYRYRLGEFECTAINDGAFRRPLDANFVRNATLQEVEQTLDDAFLPIDMLDIQFTALLVNTGEQLVMIDTGTGGQMAMTAGTLQANLAAAGIKPEQVDTILISHFHGDHIYGIKSKDEQYMFPNAEIVVPQAEWDYWMAEERTSDAPESRRGLVKRINEIFGPIANDVRRIGDDVEVVPGIRSVATPGHTPGHTSYHVDSNFEELMVLGDLTNIPALFVRRPGWHAVFDMDAEMAETSRRALLDRVAADRIRVAGYHFPFPSTGHIRKLQDGYELVPSNWDPLV